MGDEKIAVIEIKMENIMGDIKELYKRSNETNKAINDLNISIIKLSGALENFTTRLDGSIESLATKLDDKITQMNGDINKIACKNEKADDREKKKIDSVWGYVIGGIIGVVFGLVGTYLAIK